MRPFVLDPPDLSAALADLLRGVPAGRAATFGDLAAALGAKTAAVWVGTVCRRPPADWGDVPVHRAVRATGECVLPDQPARLAAEGAPVHFDADGAGRVDLGACRFADFPQPGPLHGLKAEQAALAVRVTLDDDPVPFDPAGPVGAVDVAYPDPRTARAAYVEMTPDVAEPTFTLAVEVPVRFPYVSGFLSYRELPAYGVLFARLCEAGRRPPAVLVDGNGALHPRRCGVACGLGVLVDLPTVGVAKKKLCGTVTADHMVELDGEPLGLALANPAIRGSNAVFVSPGHRVSAATAGEIAAAWFRGHRLPEPLYFADRLSKGREPP